MRKIVAGVCFLFSGCSLNQSLHLGEGQEVAHTLPVTKQKQRITFLQKKLDHAERDLRKSQDEVDRLHNELHQSQLSLIEKQIEIYEKQIRKIQEGPRPRMQISQGEGSSLFLKEREMLQHMMESGPSPSAFEAQVVLDRILRMITEYRDVQEVR